MNRALIALTVVCAVAATTACGGEDDGSAISGTTSTTPATTTTTTVPGDPQQLLDASRERYGAPGGLTVVDRDGTRSFAASGAADLAGTPITADTRFRIASITKPITAALVLDAAARGELSLDDIVSDFVPDVLRPDPPITVRMLLEHTSGVFDETNDGALEDIERLTDPALREEAAALLAAYQAGEQVAASARLIVALSEIHDRYFPPGTGYYYSNTNFQLAGMVLEAATGLTFGELVEQRIVAPLGLEATTVAPADRGSPELRGYGTDVDDGTLVDLTDDLALFGNGASGGIISTAGELLTIMEAILSGEIVDSSSLAEMTPPTEQSGNSYGLGLASYHLSCGTFHGHEGGVNGTASIAIVDPEGEEGAVIALNLRSGADPRLPALADDLLCTP